jgi:hypothetical protein
LPNTEAEQERADQEDTEDGAEHYARDRAAA